MSTLVSTPASRRVLLQSVAIAGVAATLARLGAIPPAVAAANRLTFGTVGGAYLDTIKKIYIEEPGFAKANDVDIVWDV